MTLIRFKASQEQDADLSITYDAVVVGSGAAGGMAAHVLTSQGMKVLLLEAGKKIDINAELRSMEWAAGAARTTSRTSWSTRSSIRIPAPSTPGCARGCSAARPTSGAASRCGSPTTTSRARRTMGSAKTGRSRTPTSSPTTTRSISTSASPATRRTCRICPIACFSGRTSSPRQK